MRKTFCFWFVSFDSIPRIIPCIECITVFVALHMLSYIAQHLMLVVLYFCITFKRREKHSNTW